MPKIERLQHEFVDSFPEPMQPGILYVSLKFSSAGHLCCCGCNNEVITPISPTDWKMIFDGDTVSLHPSIGSWKLACRSHYFISRGRVEWSTGWSPQRVAAADRADRVAKADYYAQRPAPEPSNANTDKSTPPATEELSTSLWLRLRNLWK